MVTIWAADGYRLAGESTTHVLSSGVAGTMAANRSGLQMSTVRNIAMAWVFTLPAAALLSGGLFWLFGRMAQLRQPICSDETVRCGGPICIERNCLSLCDAGLADRRVAARVVGMLSLTIHEPESKD